MRIWLINLRKSANLTQRLLAKKAQTSYSTICRIELGSRRPSPELAQKIAKALNFDWTKFYDDSPK